MTNLLKRAQESAEHRAAAEQHNADELVSLRKAVLDGDTTGDPFQDYVIYRYGCLETSAVERLHALSDALTGKTGQLVLVDYVDHVRWRYSGCFGRGGVSESDYQDVNRASLAILLDDKLVIERGEEGMTCRLPFNTYLSNGTRVPKIIEGCVTEQVAVGESYQLRDLWVAGEDSNPGRGRFLVTAGDDQVLSRLNARSFTYPWKPDHKPKEFALALELLGRLSFTAEE